MLCILHPKRACLACKVTAYAQSSFRKMPFCSLNGKVPMLWIQYFIISVFFPSSPSSMTLTLFLVSTGSGQQPSPLKLRASTTPQTLTTSLSQTSSNQVRLIRIIKYSAGSTTGKIPYYEHQPWVIFRPSMTIDQ